MSEFKLDAARPEFTKFREIAVKRGLDQDTVTDLVGVYAETLVGEQSSFAAAQKAEMDKLGANATARVTALQTFFKGVLGEEDAKALNSAMYGSKIVEAMERLATKFSSQGAAPFSQAHREPAGAPGKVTEEQFQAMSAAERLDYVRSHNPTAH